MTSNLFLEIDYRESDFIDYNLLSVPFVKVNLQLGDFRFVRKDMNDNEKVLCIIERKTITDYVASISDGRNKEQTFRINEYLDNNVNNNLHVPKIIYLIEGEIPINNYKFRGGITGDSLYSSICNKMIRDNFYIFQTKNLNDSAKFIDKLYSKYSQHKEETKNNDYSKTLKLSKKDHLTPDIWFKLTLAQIPSVSIDIAQIIMEKYGTLVNLYKKYMELSKYDGQKLLSNIIYGKRRIGDVLSERIYSFLMYGYGYEKEDINPIKIEESVSINITTPNKPKFKLTIKK